VCRVHDLEGSCYFWMCREQVHWYCGCTDLGAMEVQQHVHWYYGCAGLLQDLATVTSVSLGQGTCAQCTSRPGQGSSHVVRLSTGFLYEVLSLSTKPEVPCCPAFDTGKSSFRCTSQRLFISIVMYLSLLGSMRSAVHELPDPCKVYLCRLGSHMLCIPHV
jgi:hypothetical protein